AQLARCWNSGLSLRTNGAAHSFSGTAWAKARDAEIAMTLILRAGRCTRDRRRSRCNGCSVGIPTVRPQGAYLDEVSRAGCYRRHTRRAICGNVLLRRSGCRDAEARSARNAAGLAAAKRLRGTPGYQRGPGNEARLPAQRRTDVRPGKIGTWVHLGLVDPAAAGERALIDVAVPPDVGNRHIVAGADRLQEPDQRVDLLRRERLHAVAIVHELDADRCLVVVQRVVGHAILGRAGQGDALSVDHVVDAEEGMAIEERLPALSVTGCSGELQLSIDAGRPADGMDDDRVDPLPPRARGRRSGRPLDHQRQQSRRQNETSQWETPSARVAPRAS